MKRVNPETGKPFKQGDIRADGFIFRAYVTTRIKKDGHYVENWYSPDAYSRAVECVRKGCAEWYVANKEEYKRKQREDSKIWRKENKDKHRAQQAKRRCSKLERTPAWLSDKQLEEIKWKYSTACHMEMLTGEKYHVDHIVPLQGELVSGLHVPWNLRVITAQSNLSKSNKLTEELL
jgi:hypothetical protein